MLNKKMLLIIGLVTLIIVGVLGFTYTPQSFSNITQLGSFDSTGLVQAALIKQGNPSDFPYRVQSISDNESIFYNVSIVKVGDDYEYLLVPKFSGSIVIQQDFAVNISDINSKIVTRNITYTQPSQIKVTEKNGTTFFTDKNLTSSQFRGKIPKGTTWLKLGEQSIIIVGDSSYNSTDLNVTQETGFAHSNITDDSILGYYPFDSNVSQITVYDYTNNSIDGLLAGVPMHVADGVYGNALGFDGSGNFVDMDDNFDMGNIEGKNITFSWWARSTSATPSGAEVYIGKVDGGFVGYLMSMRGDLGGDIIELEYRNGGGDQSTININTSQIALDEWHYYVWTYNGCVNITCQFFYIDGVNQTKLNIGDTLSDEIGNTGSFNIGGRNDGSGLFDGQIDEVTISNEAWSPTRVNDTFKNQSARYAQFGYQNFTDENVSVIGTENRVNITINNATTGAAPYFTLFDTNLSVTVDDGVTWTNFSEDGKITGLSFSTDPNFFNITFGYYSGASRFYAPIVIGNITIDSWLQTGDTCSCPGAGFNWLINHADACVINDECYLAGGNISLIGTGTTICNATIEAIDINHSSATGIFDMRPACFINQSKVGI